MTYPAVTQQLTVAMTATWKTHTSTENACCLSPKPEAHPCSWISHEYSSHSFQFPPFCFLPPIYALHWNHVKKLIWKFKFLILHSLDIIKLVLFQSQFCYWLRRSEQKKNPSMDPGSQFSNQKILLHVNGEWIKGRSKCKQAYQWGDTWSCPKKHGAVEMVKWTQIMSLFFIVVTPAPSTLAHILCATPDFSSTPVLEYGKTCLVKGVKK